MKWSDLFNTAAAGVQGFADAATLGLVKYPQALVYSQAMGMPYQEALREVRREEERTRNKNPVAYTGGSLAGTVAQAFVPGGGVVASPARLAALGAVQGATTGFTANEGFDTVGRDVLTGSVLGAGLGAAGGVASRASKTAREVYGKTPEVQKVHLDKIAGRMDKAREKMEQDPAFLRLAAENPGLSFNELRNMATRKGAQVAPATVQAARRHQGAQGSMTGAQTQMKDKKWTATGYSLLPAAKQTAVDALRSSVKPALETAMYGGLGYGAGSALNFEDPVSIALLAAGARGGQTLLNNIASAKVQAGTQLAAGLFHPRFGESVGRTTIPLVTRSVVERPAHLQQDEIPPWERDWPVLQTPEAEPETAQPVAPSPRVEATVAPTSTPASQDTSPSSSKPSPAPKHSRKSAEDESVPPWERTW